MSRKDSVAHRLAHEIKPIWLRVPTAVQQTGICQAKLYQWIKDGRIRSVGDDMQQKEGIRFGNYCFNDQRVFEKDFVLEVVKYPWIRSW
jgi:hypothetical protein